jgi:uncharacterized protein YunC (DUF1805 family)
MLGLSLVVYFLYREVDILNRRLASVESQILGEPLENTSNKPKLQIRLPTPPPNERTDEYTNEYTNEHTNEHTNERTNEYTNEYLDNINENTNQKYIENVILDGSIEADEVNETHNTVEEYSNEQNNTTDIAQLYSHDRMDSITNEQDTLMVDSIVDMVNDTKNNMVANDTKKTQSVDDLLKNKLEELQKMATELGLSITYDNGKKKKKVDLANDIINNN